MELSDNLFRRESGKIVAALIKIFGVHNLDLAEDVTQDAFCRAIEVWRLRGIPPNPAAWLMTTAKHRALDALRRERTARTFAPEVGRLLESEWTLVPVLNELMEPNAIRDDQLRVMFSCCDPRLIQEGQVALILNIVCGFSAQEIAGGFLISKAAMEKRITRAKKVLASSKSLFEVAEFSKRLPSVHQALYLLFNEGYHGSSPEIAVRSSLCEEAIWLVHMLLSHALGATSTTSALGAMMCLHAGRLPARLGPSGELTPLCEQDRSLWNRELIDEGSRLLEEASVGNIVSEFHLEAMIAFHHAQAPCCEETDWGSIVGLYDLLLKMRTSPVIALNRAIAIGQLEGPDCGLEALLSLPDRERLETYPFYPAAIADLYLKSGNSVLAKSYFAYAASLARNPAEKQFLLGRLGAC